MLYIFCTDGYNKYIQLCADGILAPSEQIVFLPELRDETKIKDLLSYSSSDDQNPCRCGFLYDLIYHLVGNSVTAVVHNQSSILAACQ